MYKHITYHLSFALLPKDVDLPNSNKKELIAVERASLCINYHLYEDELMYNIELFALIDYMDAIWYIVSHVNGISCISPILIRNILQEQDNRVH